MPDDGPAWTSAPPSLGHLPVVVIGAGPVGLAAAAHLLARGLAPLVLETGDEVAASVRAWGHVRMFSPWRYNIDAAARALLEGEGWKEPDLEAYPTGADLVALYLAPLARVPALARAIRTGTRVVGVTKSGHDLMRDGTRDDAAFVVQVADHAGAVTEIEAAAVIDCSGTWTSPNPAGANGLPAPGERAAADRIVYGIPDVAGTARAIYAGRTTLVIGGGHSAMNAVLDLATLAATAPDTRVLWAFRNPLAAVNFGGGAADGLAERGALGARARELAETGLVSTLAPFLTAGIAPTLDGRLAVTARDGQVAVADRIIVAAGFRPDVSLLSELRLRLDPAVQCTPALAPLIDPNVHSCGTVRPHGEAELRHPENRVWIAGMKSYGRAPTFLLATGHEQVRSIAAALAGDWVAAREVHLDLPETGVCSTDRGADASAGCCTPTTAQGTCCAPKAELAAAAPCCGGKAEAIVAAGPAKPACCG
jgi:hypothetical protein